MEDEHINAVEVAEDVIKKKKKKVAEDKPQTEDA